MNLMNPRRTELSSVPFLNNALDRMSAQVNGVWNVEHTPDGSHGDITADSLEVDGPVVINGPITGEIDAVMETLRLRSSSPPALVFAEEEDDLNVVLTRAEVSSIPVLQHTSSIVPATLDLSLGDPIMSYRWVYLNETGGLSISGTKIFRDAFGSAGTLSIDGNWLPDANNTRDLGLSAGLIQRRWRNLYLSGSVYTGGRTVADGEWLNEAFSAGNFTSDVGTWVVASGDVVQNRYMLVGKTLFWSLEVVTTTVTGTPVQLRATLPGGFTIATGSVAQFIRAADNGSLALGVSVISAGQTYVDFRSTIGGSGWANATDNTAIQAWLQIEIQ